jgi:methionyl aminopeptidase
VHRIKLQSPTELKSIQDIAKMREAGKIVAQALQIAREMARPGIRTVDINTAIEDFFRQHNATSLFKGYVPGEGYTPFPAVTCLSVNEQVVHGIPGIRTLKEGDLLKIDTACRLNGWCADAAITVPIGRVRPERLRLLKVAEETLQIAITEMARRRWWTEVAVRMQTHAEQSGFSLVKQYVGHGIGRNMHEQPQVPNFSDHEIRANADFQIEPGLVLAVEPMLNMGQEQVDVDKDKWTVITRDGMPSVHVEHTIAVTANGVVVLTVPDGDPRGEIVLPTE